MNEARELYSKLGSIIIYSRSVLIIHCLELSGPSHNPEKLIWKESRDCPFNI